MGSFSADGAFMFMCVNAHFCVCMGVYAYAHAFLG